MVTTSAETVLAGDPYQADCPTRRISQKLLTQTLRGLERDGLVRRTVYPEVPARVVYGLTEAGRTLQEPLRALQEWSIAHLGDVAASQQAYDQQD